MINLLKGQFIRYLANRQSSSVIFEEDEFIVKAEVTSDVLFDIMDKKETILQPIGEGSATYNNPEGKTITFIDYEDFINQLPDSLSKNIKRCDFLAYDSDCTSFILNELSQSGSRANKLNDARKQLHKTAFLLCGVAEIKEFIYHHKNKQCIFSNKQQLISTPNNIADAFSLICNYLPQPIHHNFQPIAKLGFELIETAIINV
jgi:hypothetical protein